MPFTKRGVTPDGAATLTNKTMDGDNNTFSDIPVTGLKEGTDGQLITWGADGEPTTVATGNAGQVLTSNGAGTAPTFQDAAGGSTPEFFVSTAFETAARFETASAGTGAVTFGVDGAVLSTGATGNSAYAIRMAICARTEIDAYNQSPKFSTSFNMGTIGTTGSVFIGIGQPATAGAGHTFTNRHIGFKVVIAASVATLYATQADNTTENATSLTTLVDTDAVEVICEVNDSSSVDYYYRLNGGALSAATNLTSNMPTITQNESRLSWSISNNSTASNSGLTVSGASYRR